MWQGGPSWLSSQNDGFRAQTDDSPPMKWPRVATPTHRRQSILNETDDSGIGLSFSSPPVVNKSASRPSPLRTPSSRAVIHMTATPSPFRSFRLAYSSPSFSDRALRLSNSENVIGVKFCEDSMEKVHGQLDLTRLASPTVARCLDLPLVSRNPCSNANLPCSTANVEDHHLDQTLPMHSADAPETPSKCFPLDDESGIFDDSFPHLLSTSTPLKRLSSFDQNNRVPLNGMDTGCFLPLPVDPECSSPPPNEKVSPPTPSSFKKAMQQVQRQGQLQPRQILTSDDTQPPTVNSLLSAPLPSIQPGVKRKKELESDEIFRSPKKPLKPFSRRWIRLVTGGTRAQRDLTLAAKTFLNQRTTLNRMQSPNPASAFW